MRKSQSEGMLCLEGKQVKALGKSSVAGLQLGKKLDLFFPQMIFFFSFWQFLALLILLVQESCDLLCFFPSGQGKGSASTSAARG